MTCIEKSKKLTKAQLLLLFGLCALFSPLPGYSGEDLLRGFQGQKRSCVTKVDGESFEYTVLTLDKPVPLSGTGADTQKTNETDPVSILQSVTRKFKGLDIEGVKAIKKYHASDDVMQTAPDQALVRILSETPPEKREDWKLTQAIAFGDILFLKAQFKNLNNGKQELDVWPFIKAGERWQIVIGNPKFNAERGPQFLRLLQDNKLDIK